MSIFTLQSVKKDFGIKEILQDASFSIDATDKVGLIGRNGSGKSTLLKIIAGLESIDSGQILVNSGAKIIYLPQQPELDENLTALEQVFADSGDRMALVREYETLSDKLAHLPAGHSQDDPIGKKLMARLSEVMHRMDTESAWELETQAKIIMTKLGIEDFDAPIASLSGGYRKRIALAAALLSEPDVLLMDEPTNHLDAESVEWLQSYLNRYRGALLLITHDRYFLDRVTNRILEIDGAELFTYAGNYSYFLEKKALAEESEASSQRKHKGVLRKELEWLKRGPKARSTKQKARIDRIRSMQTQQFRTVQGKVDISTPGRRIGKKVIELANVCKGYDGRTLIQDFSYNFSPEDRVGIIGSNGIGKSTLIDTIVGRVQPDRGTVEIGSTIVIGYFDQHSEDLLDAAGENQRAIDYIKEVGEFVKISDGTQISASQMLERFLFSGNQQYAPIHMLSGGEKRRLFLLRILMSEPNVLILDEPTNDLDVQTLTVLEDYLEDFNGCAIIVSHDRYFLDRTVETIFAFEPGGTIRQYPGNYSVYLDHKKAEEEKLAEAAKDTASSKSNGIKSSPKSIEPEQAENIEKPQPTAAAATATKSRKLNNKEKRELEALEMQVPQMEAEKIQIETSLYRNPPSGFSEVQKLSERLAELTAAIESSTERWLELAELH
jgi:ABC transport system ATP-binding/permease protein